MSSIFLLATFGVICISNAAIINQDVKRHIVLTSSIVRMDIEIQAINCDDNYMVVFPELIGKHMAYVAATEKGKSLTVAEPISDGKYTYVAVLVTSPSVNLKVSAAFTDALEPYPAEITQSSRQLMRFFDSHYFTSPYDTILQKTTVKLSSSVIISYTKLEPYASRGSVLSLGPYRNIGAYEDSEFMVHYMNNKPFAKITALHREVEVSHWGNVAFEEVCDLKHAGAVLSGGFSRLDYQRSDPDATASFRSIHALLPSNSRNIYYRDQIGNISTSDLKPTKDHNGINMELQFRFPMFGGWKNQFYIGYSLPTSKVLFNEPETGAYRLKLNFYTVFRGVWVEDMETKIILPEGCRNIKVNVPFDVEQGATRRYTFLDTALNGGRPVVRLRAHNLVQEHVGKVIEISYEFDRYRLLVEPLLLFSGFLSFFVICIVMSRLTVFKKRKL